MPTKDTSPRLDARALVAGEGGVFSIEDVLTPPLTSSSIAVATTWSGVSFGTEFAILTGRLDWGPFPLVTGYMGVGRVVEVGADVPDYEVGDRVYYRRNKGMLHRKTGKELTCASGGHASVVVLDPSGSHGADHLPDLVPDDVASTFVLPAVGLTGVDEAGVGVGDRVVVIGSGLVGLAVVAASVARGANVLAVDFRPGALELALRLGAAHVVPADQDVQAQVEQAMGPDGVDFVFESTGRQDSVDLGIRLLREHGCFIWQGNYGIGKVAFEFLPAHHRRIRMVFPCDDGLRPARRAVMASLALGTLNWGATITDRVEASDAPAFYEGVFKNGPGDSFGATIHWAD